MKSNELVFIGICVLAFIIVVQNAQVVAFRFLFWQVGMSKIILFILAFLLGFISALMLRKKGR